MRQRLRQSSMPGSRISGHDWNGILIEASELLSEPQLGVLKGMQAREQFDQAINRGAPNFSGATDKGSLRR
jgi:hypothetical protein